MAALVVATACAPARAPVEGLSWTTGAPLPTPRTEVGVAALDGLVYVAGGFEGDGATSDVVEVYDPEAGSWSIGERMPVALHHASLVAVEGRLWLLGGYDADGVASDRMWSLAPDEETWRDEPSMAEARGAAGAAAWTGVISGIVVVGGATGLGQGSVLVERAELFDVASRHWIKISALPEARDHLAATSTQDGALFIVGGRRLSLARNTDALQGLAIQDRRSRWLDLAALPTPRGGLAAASVGNRLFVFGGEQPSSTFDTTEVYDVATGAWSSGPPMPTARHGLGAAAVGDRIFVVGGGPEPGLSVSGANEILTVEDAS